MNKTSDLSLLGCEMHVFVIRKSGAKDSKKRTYEQILVQSNPTPGTWGNLQMLTDEYKLLDMEWEMNYGAGKLRQVRFNIDWLIDMRAKHRELHCEYCGKAGLKIYKPSASPAKNIMATVDHFLSRSLNPGLAFAKHNLLVCCNACNQRKDNKLWPKSSVKFPYPEHLSLYRE
jgi:hypothetical protein